jgi:hypothetical protein
MYLISGSWREIFRVLHTAPSLVTSLPHLGKLYQTDRDGTLRPRPSLRGYAVCYSGVVLVRDANVVPYLEDKVSAFDFNG